MRPGGRRPATWVAVAVVLVSLTATAALGSGSERDALIARWQAANPHGRLSRSETPLATPPPQLRAMAARELSSGYRLGAIAPPPPRTDPWWLKVGRWLADRWSDLWRATFGRTRLGRGGAVAIGDVLLVAAIGVVAFAVWRLLGGLFLERSSPPPTESLERYGDPRALYAAACDRARGGEYAAASRLLFAATVGTLALRGIVRENRSATVGDLRRAVRRGDDSLLAPFDAVAAAFVTGTYAELPVDAFLWERALRAYLALDGAA